MKREPWFIAPNIEVDSVTTSIGGLIESIRGFTIAFEDSGSFQQVLAALRDDHDDYTQGSSPKMGDLRDLRDTPARRIRCVDAT